MKTKTVRLDKENYELLRERAFIERVSLQKLVSLSITAYMAAAAGDTQPTPAKSKTKCKSRRKAIYATPQIGAINT
jgi:hypothetical protein